MDTSARCGSGSPRANQIFPRTGALRGGPSTRRPHVARVPADLHPRRSRPPLQDDVEAEVSDRRGHAIAEALLVGDRGLARIYFDEEIDVAAPQVVAH